MENTIKTQVFDEAQHLTLKQASGFCWNSLKSSHSFRNSTYNNGVYEIVILIEFRRLLPGLYLLCTHTLLQFVHNVYPTHSSTQQNRHSQQHTLHYNIKISAQQLTDYYTYTNEAGGTNSPKPIPLSWWFLTEEIEKYLKNGCSKNTEQF